MSIAIGPFVSTVIFIGLALGYLLIILVTLFSLFAAPLLVLLSKASSKWTAHRPRFARTIGRIKKVQEIDPEWLFENRQTG